MGATDVVPFVPLRDVDMATCVALARQLGQRVGDELGIPVYLYEAAASATTGSTWPMSAAGIRGFEG